MNAHQTIGIVRATAKAPAGAPPSRLATRMAGKNVAKHSVEPNETRTSCMAAANAITSNAAANAEGDHGLTLRMMCSAPLRTKLPRETQSSKCTASQIQAIARKTQLKAHKLPARCTPEWRFVGQASDKHGGGTRDRTLDLSRVKGTLSR